jgi:exodeoxyribonuclease V beta subunit
MARFDANRFPLSPGVHLLEASAGTGKTFALAHLVLRLVAERGWSLRELLVVTYTEAAAAELRDRIATRLQAALTALDNQAPGDPAPPLKPPAVDATLTAWLEKLRSEEAAQEEAAQEPALLRGRLLLALEELSGADITTIHGFCRRTLQRQALEAGCAPDLRIETQSDGLMEQVVHDYWQQQVLPLPVHLVAGLLDARIDPDLIETLLTTLDGDPALGLEPLPTDLSPETPLGELLPAIVRQRWEGFLAQWRERGEALEAELRTAAADWKAAAVKGAPAPDTKPYSDRPRTDRVAVLTSWIDEQPQEGDYEAVRDQKLLSGYFHPGSFCRVARKLEGKQPQRLPQEPLLRAVAALLEGPAELVLLHACHWGRAELVRRRERRGMTTFSELLERLDPGLDDGVASPLLEAVARRYRAALVDEFQDTDPIQWRILRRAFGQGLHPLVLVGDPKQAIYRFRGGDLDTYRAASRQAGEPWELVENHRSTEALVEGFNGLMAPGLRRSQLAVPAVNAKANRQGPQGPPIDLLWLGPEPAGDPNLPSRTDLETRLPAWIANTVEELLAAGLRVVDKGTERTLEAADYCLLVSHHRQAEQLRQALERRGIASRLVSKADVFDTPAATALQRFLDALADPADPNRLRLLASSPLQGWSAERIATTDSAGWSTLAGRLDGLARQLPRRGLLGVLADWLGADTLARLAWGGRLLADLQQVAQLVQEHLHGEQLGAAAAADWLRRLRLAEDRVVPEEHQAHSDRADGAVAVVTIHRSKGLEFPLVICPYLWESASGGGRGPGRIGRRWHPPGVDRPHLDLHLNSGWGPGYEADRQQRLAEEQERERLAYVALTRARHRLVLAWGPARDQQCNPLFPWLFADEALPELDDDSLATIAPALWRQRLEQAISERALPIRLLDPPPAPTAPPRRSTPPPQQELVAGPVPRRRLDSRWGRSSYTSWTQASHAALAPAALEEGRDTLDPDAPAEEGGGVPLAGKPVAHDSQPAQAGRSQNGSSAKQLNGPETVAGGTRGLQPAPEAENQSGDNSTMAWPDQGPLATFPRGAAAGDCLHRILERVELTSRLQAAPEATELVERELRRAGLERESPDGLLEGLERMRTTPFGGPLQGLLLADLPACRRLHEMNFDLTLERVRAADLATAFANHPGGLFGADYAASLAQLPIDSSGFLTGSIDLVFRADPEAAGGDGRWWVADWKSNWLGQRDVDGQPLACGPRHYSQAAMAALMAASHYPLQAHLYLVALHRYLNWRLRGYDPQVHLGGYAYVFLRGTPGPAGEAALPGSVPGMVVERPPLGRILALDQALGGGSGAAGRPS